MGTILAALAAVATFAASSVVPGAALDDSGELSPAASGTPVRDMAIAPEVLVGDVTYDEVTGRAYVVVPGADQEFGNHLVAFDPANGEVLEAVWVGSDPEVVEVSTDGSIVWVGFAGAYQLVQVNAATMTVLRRIDLGPLYTTVTDISPLPGDADAAVIRTFELDTTFGDTAIVVVDGGTLLPNTLTAFGGPVDVEAESATRVIGFASSFGGNVIEILLDDDGVASSSTINSTPAGFSERITVDDGRIYAGRHVIDAASGADIGNLGIPTYGAPIVEDGLLYAHNDQTITVLDPTTFDQIGDLVFLPQGVRDVEFTPAGWLAWDEASLDRFRFVTDTVRVDGPAVAGGGDRRFATAPDLEIADAVFDEGSGLVYAVVPASAPSLANRLVAFDPADGSISGSVVVGADPSVVERSDDGSTIWVGLTGANDLVEVERATLTVRRTIDLGMGMFDPNFAVSIAPVPGTNDAAVVALDPYPSCCSATAALVDGGVVAPNTVDGPTIVAAVSDALVVGFKGSSSSFGFHRMPLDGDGVTLPSPAQLTAFQGGDLVAVDGIVYGSDGTVIEPASATVLGRLGDPDESTVSPLVGPDHVYIYDDLDGRIRLYDRTWFVEQPQPILLDDLADGAVLTDEGLLAWNADGFLSGSIFFEMATVRGTVVSDQTAQRIDGLCVDAYPAGDLDFPLQATTITSITGEWQMSVPVGDYWILYYECQFAEFFDEWHGDAKVLDVGAAAVVSVDTPDAPTVLFAELRPRFVDVPVSAFYFGPSVFLWDAGITNGCGLLLYCPNDQVTREQMAAFMARFWRLFGDCPNLPSPFGDVGATSFAYNDVGCIAWLGVTTGTGPDTYSPSNNVTREQMAAFIARLWRAFGLECPTGPMPFSDMPVTSFAHDDVICIFELGITTGTSTTTYSPGQLVTRAQMAAFLQRLFSAVIARAGDLETSSLEPRSFELSSLVESGRR
ncbi:MAG: S-layer homology domain-containing protein [Actinomycetota bacterium]